MADNKDLGTQGDEDTLKGKLNQAGGKLQEKAGELTGNRRMEREGEKNQVKGNVQEGVGKIERKVDDALDS